jgi:hypothetical protein
MGFTNWRLIKQYEGATDITSESPLDDRIQFAMSTTQDQAAGSFFALAKLRQHADVWAFDTTDLDWEIRFDTDRPIYVLKLRDDFDVSALTGLFEERGFAQEQYGEATIYSKDLDLANDDWITASEFVILNTAVLAEANILVMANDPAPVKGVLDAVAAPAGDPGVESVTEALRGTAALAVVKPPQSCRGVAIPVPAGLQQYQAVAVGYRYTGDELQGTIAIGFDRRTAAEADLSFRATEARNGISHRTQRPYSESVFAVDNAAVEGRTIVFDVSPTDEMPVRLFQMALSQDMSFAVCPG